MKEKRQEKKKKETGTRGMKAIAKGWEIERLI